jgi:hypothetical protein
MPRRYAPTEAITATVGTASAAPAIPPTTPPPASASRITAGCSLTARPSTSGASTWPSSCCTAMVMPTMISAATRPLLTSATSAATRPLRNAPTIGKKAPRNTRKASGTASGTPTIARPMPMNTPSISPTVATPRR